MGVAFRVTQNASLFTFGLYLDVCSQYHSAMRSLLPSTFILLAMLTSCSDTGTNPLNAQSSSPGKSRTNWVEGKDYTVLERVRFMDEHGFERPAEAFSVLLPKGWKTTGGVAWKGLNECRGEMISARYSAVSPDGAIKFETLPIHSWGSATDPMMYQNMMMQAQNGGCQVAPPMDAEQYLREVFLPMGLNGATIVEVKNNDEAKQASDERAMKYRQQQGYQTQVQNSAVTARLKWSDGTEGIALCQVMNIIMMVQDPYTGNVQRLSTSNANERSYIRFPAERRQEAEQVLATLKSSFRTNPEWQQAIDGYFANLRQHQDRMHHQRMAAIAQQTQANTAAHNQRMRNIQAQGAANTARHNERMGNMDASMRSWESQQSSNDRIHSSFVKTIREVETYRDGNGTVELSSGYDQAWSRGDGTYILSNSPGFDPSSVFQDQNWQEMNMVK